MKLEVNFSKKTIVPIVAAVLALASIITVIAFGTNNPSTMGHSIGEIAPPAGCTSGQVLSWTGTTWSCSTSSSGGNQGLTTASCGLIYDNFGQPGGGTLYQTVNVPLACQQGKECLLTFHVNNEAQTYVSYRQIPQFSFSGGGTTSGTGWLLGGAFQGDNGDSQSVDILGNSNVMLVDDFINPGNYQEITSSQWTVKYSGVSNTGYKIYACTI